MQNASQIVNFIEFNVLALTSQFRKRRATAGNQHAVNALPAACAISTHTAVQMDFLVTVHTMQDTQTTRMSSSCAVVFAVAPKGHHSVNLFAVRYQCVIVPLAAVDSATADVLP